MQLATQLLITAQMLINLVIANPNLPQNVKVDALNQAFASITSAQAELNKPQTTQVDTQIVTQPVQPVIPVVQPVQNTQNNAIIVGTTNQQTMEIILKDANNNVISDTLTVPITNISQFINVDYLVDGKSQKVDITMSSSDGQSRTILGSERGWSQRVTGGARDDGSANFNYRLNSVGQHTVTFTANNTSKVITIDVQ